MTRRAWRTDTPPVGRVVEVWLLVAVVLARFDGAAWRDEAGRVLAGPVTHWREG